MSKYWAQIQSKLPITDSEPDQQLRNKYWSRIDENANGYLSLAEIDKGLRDIIKLPVLFDLKPVIMRAFQAAKIAVKDQSQYGNDYVTKPEFKPLMIYLRQYYEYWIAFEKIDKSKDRRISAAEFVAAKAILTQYGIDGSNPAAIFNQIDVNNGGFVLFDEFCDWAIKKNFQFHIKK